MTTRSAPTYSELSRDFWTGGGAGELLIQRCQSCANWQHPPRSMCAQCHSRELAFEVSSGRGAVWSFTISRMAWGLDAPYVVAEVALDDQAGLHLITNIVGSGVVEIGTRVVVAFDNVDDTWVPVFQRKEAS